MKLQENNPSFNAYDLRVMATLRSPAFIDSPAPELSWKIASTRTGFQQIAYRIKAASSVALLLNAPDLWDSGRVESGQTLMVEWRGRQLRSRQKCYWQVMVWDDFGTCSDASEIGTFEVALLDNSEWHANWIHSGESKPNYSCPCPYFRREFQVTERVDTARLYVSARGLFEASINGARVGDDQFVPGWTDFRQQLQFLSYDVTELIKAGHNAIGAVIGDGWYCGNLTNQRRRDFYGKHPELLMQLELIYADGHCEVISTDGTWKCTTGPILYSDIYDGEMYDARLEMPGWNQAEFDDAAWHPVLVGDTAQNSPPLVPKACPPVRRIMELQPVKILNPQKDIYIWDFGQNISGRIKMRVKGHPGFLCTIRFGEMLNPDGSLYNLNYRGARSTDYYICRGPIEEKSAWWEPHFTFHGFRYAQIDGFQYFTGLLDDIEVVAVVLHSDLDVTGDWQCGVQPVNQLYRNILWSQRSNFLEIPTDCPQRDERLGWTGDAGIFIDTACHNMNVDGFFRKWMRDLRESQRDDGAGPCCAPCVLPFGYGAAGWSDALVIIPYAIYRHYGDVRILRENYPAMKKWIDYQSATSNSLLRPDTSFGDWLAADPVKTPSSLIGTAYFAYTSRLFATVAAILKKDDEAKHYRQLSNEVCVKFKQKFLDADGLLNVKNQTSCALAIALELLDDEQLAKNGELLRTLVVQNGGRLSTGFIGTAWLLPALSRAGQSETAYDLLLQDAYPSWLYSVNQGATTVWERWNSYSHEHGFGNVNMNSFNHYAYGAVASWMTSWAGGIGYNSQAERELTFTAHPNRRMQYIRTSLKTPYGPALSNWRYAGPNVIWQVSAPANTLMIVAFATDSPETVTMNGKRLEHYDTNKTMRSIKLPCGTYEFIFTPENC